jgi:hypothetical protein
MAQTNRRRRRKHRGTQGGSIDRGGRSARPRSRQEARSRAKRQMADRRDIAPTWRSAFNRGAIAAVIFFALLLLLFKRPVAEALPLAGFMLAVYIPMGYYLDQALYRRRQAQKQRARARAQQEHR